MTKRGERFASCRADWTKKSNLAQMYDVIYDVMLEACIASKRPVPVYTNRDGKEVSEDKRFGLKQDIKINHEHDLIFGNKNRCRTNQRKAVHVGGTTRIAQCRTVPQTVCSVNDHPFTILPFTSASGGAVCCVVIFTSNNDNGVPILWKAGVDIEVIDPVRDEKNAIDFEMNSGEGKYYPGGPKCLYNGKQVDCLTFLSKSGSITGEILVKILEYFSNILDKEAGRRRWGKCEVGRRVKQSTLWKIQRLQ